MKPSIHFCWFGTAAGLAFAASALTPTAAAPVHQSQMTISHVSIRHLKTRVTLNVDNAPIQLVLRGLFRHSGRNYVIGPNVTGTVTAGLHDVRFSAAVAAIVAVNSVPLVEKVENGIYVISVKPPPAPPAPTRTYRRMNRQYPRPVYVRPVVPPGTVVLPGAGNIRVVP